MAKTKANKMIAQYFFRLIRRRAITTSIPGSRLASQPALFMKHLFDSKA